MEIVRQRSTFDVCVIGSGPAGGFVAKELTEAGAKVPLLEAGAEVPPQTSSRRHRCAVGLPAARHAPGTPGEVLSGRDHETYRASRAIAIGVDRIRVLGGRSTRTGTRSACGSSEDDFREGSIHGLEPDWPLTYQEIAPFYSHVERIDRPRRHAREPRRAAGRRVPAPPPAMRCAETRDRARSAARSAFR